MHYTTPPHITLHCTTLYGTTPHNTTLHCTHTPGSVVSAVVPSPRDADVEPPLALHYTTTLHCTTPTHLVVLYLL